MIEVGAQVTVSEEERVLDMLLRFGDEELSDRTGEVVGVVDDQVVVKFADGTQAVYPTARVTQVG